MKWKTWAPAGMAIVLGGIAMKIGHDWMLKPHGTTEATKTMQVVAASTSLSPGQEIKSEQLTFTTVPVAGAATDTFTTASDVVGRVATVAVPKGQTITQGVLAPRGAPGGLASLLPNGMRAITVSVDETNALSGMLLPGAHVDVLGTIADGKNSITRTLLKDVLVQATGQRLTAAKTEDGKECPAVAFHTVTLTVTPHQARLIELATISARIRLVLHGLTPDTAEDEDETATIALLRGNVDSSDDLAEAKPTTDAKPTTLPSAPVVAAAPTPSTQPVIAMAPPVPTRRVELIRGGAAPVTVTFELPQTQQPTQDTANDMRQAIPNDERPEE